MAELVSVLVTFQHNRFDDFWQPHNLIFPEPLWQHWGQTEFPLPNSCCLPGFSFFFPELLPIWAIWNVLRDHLLLLLFNQLLVPLFFLSIFSYLFICNHKRFMLQPPRGGNATEEQHSGPGCSPVWIKILHRCKVAHWKQQANLFTNSWCFMCSAKVHKKQQWSWETFKSWKHIFSAIYQQTALVHSLILSVETSLIHRVR